MWRWFKRFLLLLCAVFALGAGIVHWRSYRVSSVAHWYGEKSWIGVHCSRGKLTVGIGRERIESIVTHDFYERPVKSKPDAVPFDDSFHGGQRLGIGYFQSNFPTVGYLLIPLWLVWSLATLPLVIAIYQRFKKSLRSKSNRCLNCGYDLRDSSNKCPECGRERQTPSNVRSSRSLICCRNG